MPLRRKPFVPICIKNWYTRYENIVFTSLVTEERTNAHVKNV